MKRSRLNLLVLVTLLSDCIGTSLKVTSRHEDSHNQRSPCPVPEDIAPCVCLETPINGLVLDCSAAESDTQLADVFKANFPVKFFYEFRMDGNEGVTMLGHELRNVTFQRIYVRCSNVKYVLASFILETAHMLRELIFVATLVTGYSFPFGVLKDVPNLEYFGLHSSDGVKWIPPFSSPSLSNANFPTNSIIYLHPGTFDDLPKVESINLYNNQLTHLKTNSFIVTPFLTSVGVGNNFISTVEANAFLVQDTVTEASFSIDFFKNRMEELLEESFGNVFPYLKRLYIYGNPLICGCDIAWIITNPDYLSKIDQDATCKNGVNLHDLDPSWYEENC